MQIGWQIGKNGHNENELKVKYELTEPQYQIRCCF